MAFVELAPHGADDVGRVVARTIGCADGGDLLGTLRRRLAGPAMLLVLDNCEHVVDAAASLVDGLTPIGAFRRIALPLASGGIATAAILSFIFSWNNFMFALVLAGRNTKTLPVAIFDFVGYASIDWGGLMAAATIVTLPIMIIALFTQKYIVSGLTAGATKG